MILGFRVYDFKNHDFLSNLVFTYEKMSSSFFIFGFRVYDFKICFFRFRVYDFKNEKNLVNGLKFQNESYKNVDFEVFFLFSYDILNVTLGKHHESSWF